MKRRAWEPEESTEGRAARWYARARSGDMTKDEVNALEAWLDGHADNREAYEAVDAAWQEVATVRSAPEIMAIRAQARISPRAGWRAALPRLTAACVAVVVVGASGLLVGKELGVTESRSLRAESYKTAVGERSTVTLRDGSVVTLNTDTVLRTEAAAGRRLVFLERGQAYFRVAKDARRPFIVTAAGRTITALGTAFDVRVEGKMFEVTLVEGKIKVASPGPLAPSPGTGEPLPAQVTEMAPGNQLVAAIDTQSWTVAPADTSQETSWLTGWLDFDNEPLGEVAAEFNRYSPRKIIVADARLTAKPVSGRFKADDVEAFTKALANYEIATVEAATPSSIRLAAP